MEEDKVQNEEINDDPEWMKKRVSKIERMSTLIIRFFDKNE